MEKIKESSKSQSFPSVELFLSDLEEIYEILTETSKEINISSGEYVYESLRDLRENNPQKIKKLEFQGHNPYISLSFKKSVNSVWLHIGDVTKESENAFYRISAILNKKKLPLSKFFTFPLFVIFNIIFFILLCIPKDLIQNIFPSKISFLSFVFLPLILSIFCFLFSTGYLSKINLINKNERSTFIKRKKDDIILLIMGAIIGTIIGFFLNGLLKMLK